MSNLTPQEFREKHARRLKAAIPDMQMGIERVEVAPTLLAAAKKDKMKIKLNEAIDSGKWEAGLKRVDLASWKKSIIEKGLGRVASGIDGAADKVEDFAADFLPFLDTVKHKVDAMPDLTLEDNINRMSTQIRETAKFKRRS